MTQFLQEILEQPAALCATADYYKTAEGHAAMVAAAEEMTSAKRVIATGMGSSYFLSQALQVFMARHGVAVTVINAGELLHYEMPAIDNDTLLVTISQSGESFETVGVVKNLAECGIKPRLMVITNEPESTLGRAADILLPTLAGVEEKTSTKTFITGFQILYMIERAMTNTATPLSTWETLAGMVEATLNQRHNTLPALLRGLGGADYIQLIARGPVMASACQSALMSMEASHTPSSALAGGEFRHGPLEMVGKDFVAIILAPTTSGTWEQTQKLINDILRYDGRVILVTDSQNNIQSAEGLTVVEAPAPEIDLFAITSIIPVQLAIEAWAREEKGLTPGIFTHGAKVTSIE